MNYYNYSVAAIIVQAEIYNNGVHYLLKLFDTMDQLHFSIQTYIIPLEYIG